MLQVETATIGLVDLGLKKEMDLTRDINVASIQIIQTEYGRK